MASTEAKFQISDKLGDAIFLVRGDSEQEIFAGIATLRALKEEYGMPPALQRATETVKQVFPEAQPVQPNYPPQAPEGGWGGPNATPAQQQYARNVPQATSGQEPPIPPCDHGTRRKWTFDDGNTTYYCALPKDDPRPKCKPLKAPRR